MTQSEPPLGRRGEHTVYCPYCEKAFTFTDKDYAGVVARHGCGSCNRRKPRRGVRS